MKKITIITIVLFANFMVLSTSISAQKISELDKSLMGFVTYPTNDKGAYKQMKIIYSKLYLAGQSIEKFTPNGKAGRVSSNEAAELILYTDYLLNGKTLKTGTYSFYTIPGENEWIIIVNSNTSKTSSYNEKNDVARITVPAKIASESLEAFSIALVDDGNKGVIMHLGWDKVRVEIPFVKANY